MILNYSRKVASQRILFGACLSVSFLSFGCNTEEQEEAPEKQGSFLDSDLSDAWPSDLPREDLKQVSCPASRCLVVEPKSTYCAMDPVRARRDVSLFAHKSKLHLSSGVFSLDRGAFEGLSIDFESSAIRRRLVDANQRVQFEIEAIHPAINFDLLHATTAIPSPVTSSSRAELSFDTLMQPKLWNQPHFRLGDPSSAWWWHGSSRHLEIRLSNADSNKLGSGSTLIEYAPCDFEDLEEAEFVFHLDEETTLEFVVRHQHYRDLVRRSAFRLLAVRGRFEGESIQVTDRDRLAAFGSGQTSLHQAPELAFLYRELSDTAADNEYCGLLLRPRRRGLPAGSRWNINRINCRGEATDEPIDYLSSEVPAALPLPE